MSVFVDTSAFLAVLDADDRFHARAREIWERLVTGEEDLISTSSVLVEAFALVQRRLGMEAVRAFEEDVVPGVRVVWVGEPHHRAGVAALLTAARRELSLVDCVSFLVMRELKIGRAFAFDEDFKRQGFETMS